MLEYKNSWWGTVPGIFFIYIFVYIYMYSFKHKYYIWSIYMHILFETLHDFILQVSKLKHSSRVHNLVAVSEPTLKIRLHPPKSCSFVSDEGSCFAMFYKMERPGVSLQQPISQGLFRVLNIQLFYLKLNFIFCGCWEFYGLSWIQRNPITSACPDSAKSRVVRWSCELDIKSRISPLWFIKLILGSRAIIHGQVYTQTLNSRSW